MKCPFCGRRFEFDPKDRDTIRICKFCYRRFEHSLDIHDFFNRNSNLFVIMGVFAAIALLLPQISGYDIITVNTWIQGNKASINESPLPILLPNQELFISISILASWFLMVLIGLLIIVDLYHNRNSELIYYEKGKFTLRNGDMVRLLFLLPFIALGISLTLYVMSLFWNLFQIVEYGFAIVIISFVVLLFLQNWPMIKHLIKENQK